MSKHNIELTVDTLNWVLTTLVAVVLVLRIHGKDLRRVSLGWDDCVMFVSWILLLALTVTCAFAAHSGAGTHLFELSSRAERSFNLSNALATTISIAVTSLAKTGVAATLIKNSKGWPRIVAEVTILIINISAAVVGVMLWLQCTPLRKNFETLDFGYCWPSDVMIIAQAFNSSISGTADIVLSLTAVYVVYRKTDRKGYRIGALICAKLGISAGISGFTKAAFMNTLGDGDLSYNSVNIMIWGILEPTLIIIAASLPELRGLIWRQPEPEPITAGPITSAYQDQDRNRSKRNAIKLEEDFQYVLQQYMEAGSKTIDGQSMYRTSTDSRRSEPTWWV